jgi:predicted RNA-binding protein YlxR (DUF448 family)
MATVKKVPMRMCVGCGELKPKKELIRILKGEDGYSLDTTGRKNGRGAYICPNQECMKKCVQSHGLERSFKEKIPAQVYETLQQAFEEMN